ncbi:MFS transporter [Hyphomicrobium sp.]|uniref:NTP/NDP exchange transporter n=1 Tax=Hyphomicrobium sp. TaxID=82 RepID=UPI0025BBA130|nr:MFS transporter [Hyphomicrobium sp.]MCC7251907.1 MFS transporter [Hyphomicrobium sp.]
MTEQTGVEQPPSVSLGLLRRAVQIERMEVAAALGAFLMFALVLGGYYLIRPVRENISAEATADQRQLWFLLVFIVMLAAVPVFGWIVARVPRNAVLPGIYAVFIGLMLSFWLALGERADGGGLGGAFFVFASVFNLFVVSLFWILMSDIYDSEQAKRLYGFIAAGGTTGAVIGPFAANTLVPIVGGENLLLIAALVFTVAAALSIWLRTAAGALPKNGAEAEAPPTLRTLLSGAERVLRDSYLMRIAVYVLIANLLSTFFYLEQARLAGETIRDATTRVQFFAERDLITSILTVVTQVFLAGRIMSRLGIGVAASLLPAITIAGLALYAALPTLQIVAAIMVAERVAAFALANPATKVLYTAVDADERYKAQSFIDTVVYRGGDALSGAVFNGLTKTMGWPLGLVALASIPLATLWLAMASRFDRALRQRLS